MLKRKAAVVGIGKVGSAVAFAFANSGLFEELVLCSRDEDKSWALAAELAYATSMMEQKPRVIAQRLGDTQNCELIILALGISQKMVVANENRTTGIADACGMVGATLLTLKEKNPDATVIVLTNPVEPCVHAALKASGFPAGRVLSTGTLLDTARLSSSIAHLFNVSAGSVSALILGEHGPAAFPVLSSATIAGMPLQDFYTDADDAILIKAALHDIRKEPFMIAGILGGTSYSVSMAALKLARAIVTDSNEVLTITVVPENLERFFDIPINVPCVVGAGGVKRVMLPVMNKQEREAFDRAAEKIRGEIEVLARND